MAEKHDNEFWLSTRPSLSSFIKVIDYRYGDGHSNAVINPVLVVWVTKKGSNQPIYLGIAVSPLGVYVGEQGLLEFKGIRQSLVGRVSRIQEASFDRNEFPEDDAAYGTDKELANITVPHGYMNGFFCAEPTPHMDPPFYGKVFVSSEFAKEIFLWVDGFKIPPGYKDEILKVFQ